MDQRAFADMLVDAMTLPDKEILRLKRAKRRPKSTV